jgi:hypothetical protein
MMASLEGTLAVGFAILFIASSLSSSGMVGVVSRASLTGVSVDGTGPVSSDGALAGAGISFPSPIRHVVVVMMENQNYSTVLAEGPFEAHLAHSYAQATDDYSVHHYSVPAYLAATSGVDYGGFGVYSVKNIGDLADSAGRTWAAFEQDMPRPCDLTNNWSDGYEAAHNPFIMYKDIESNTTRCDAHDLTWSSWTNDVKLNSIPNFSFITPNATNDDHNSSIPVGDAWLRSWLSPLINDSAVFSNTAFIISYDESGNDSSPPVNGSSGGHVYTVVVSPYSRGLTSKAFYNTFSLLTTAEWLLRLKSDTLGNDNWTLHPPLRALFSFGSSSSVVTFAESGLPTSTDWSVTLGGAVQSSRTNGISFTESNGTYAFKVGAVSGYVRSPSNGSVTVRGARQTVPVTFNSTNSVTFKDSGSPQGTAWKVTIEAETIRSETSALGLLELNGTYAHELGIVSGWKTVYSRSV